MIHTSRYSTQTRTIIAPTKKNLNKTGRAGAGDAGQDHPRMLFGLHFQPPEFSVFLHGTVQAIMLGAFAAIIPKLTAERIREKEEGLALDEAYEAGLLDDDEEDDEFGYAGGYVCATCDNTNEVGLSTYARACVWKGQKGEIIREARCTFGWACQSFVVLWCASLSLFCCLRCLLCVLCPGLASGDRALRGFRDRKTSESS